MTYDSMIAAIESNLRNIPADDERARRATERMLAAAKAAKAAAEKVSPYCDPEIAALEGRY